MANIDAYLQAIMAAVRGEEVRGSIHDAIDIINKVGEKVIDSGTAINAGDPKGDAYDKSLYINTSTNELLRCNGTIWVKVGNIKGNGITEITGPTHEVGFPLDDIYTIHYTEGPDTTFVVHNGKEITSVLISNQTGLIDTYEITYSDNSTDHFQVKNGNQWYYGILVSGEIAADTGFTLPFDVKSGDAYLNISEDSIYTCKTGAAAGQTSTWNYQFTITSASTGTNNYNMLLNLPYINGVELKGSKSLADLGIQSIIDSDGWLMDGAVVNEHAMAVGSTYTDFTAAEMAAFTPHISDGWSLEAYFDVVDGQPAPNLKNIVHYADNHVRVNYTKVKATQTNCKCKLRIIK